MNEENTKEIIEAEEAEKVEHQQKPNRQPMFIALAIIGIVVLITAAFLFFRRGESGQAVPAPRTVTFDSGGDEQIASGGEEQIITLQPGQAERIGLKLETVGETLSGEATAATSTGVVRANDYAETPVISLVGGIIRRVNVELGTNVNRGQTVAVVFSDDLAAAQSRYLTLQTETRTSRQNYRRAAQLVEISPVSSAELDEALAKLKTTQAELEEYRKNHERTVKLVEIGAASREELEQSTTKLRTAQAQVEENRSRYDRAVKLGRIKPASNTDFEQAAVKLRTAETEFASAKQRLLLLGLSEQRVNALRSPSQITSEIALTAPVSGTITSRTINQGEIIEANKELLKVSNLDTVWVIAQVYENDLARLQTGSGASVTTDAYPERLFRGRVAYIDPTISAETRTAQVRVELENPGQILKIGMYVNVAFGANGAAEKTLPVIASAAVQNYGNRRIVFAATDDPNKFIMKTVRLGAETNGQYVVLEGVNVGDKIVTEGSFLLRAEWVKLNPE